MPRDRPQVSSLDDLDATAAATARGNRECEARIVSLVEPLALHLVRSIARHKFLIPHHEDLVNEALMAAIFSARRYDPARGRFLPYVWTCMDRTIRSESKKYYSPIGAHGIRKTVVLNDPVFRLPKTLHNRQNVVMELTYDNREAAKVDARHDLAVKLEHLAPLYRDILFRRWGINGPAETLYEIGNVLDLTHERVRQLQVIAFQMLGIEGPVTIPGSQRCKRNGVRKDSIESQSPPMS